MPSSSSKRTRRAIEQIIPFTYTVAGDPCSSRDRHRIRDTHDARRIRAHLRPEDVALTFGCTRGQAFTKVTLPAVCKGYFAAASTRARSSRVCPTSLAGATRLRTEVLPTSVWPELSVGNLEAAVAVSLLLVVMAMAVLVLFASLEKRRSRSRHFPTCPTFTLGEINTEIPRGAIPS